jgi:hypothetical protein
LLCDSPWRYAETNGSGISVARGSYVQVCDGHETLLSWLGRVAQRRVVAVAVGCCGVLYESEDWSAWDEEE